MAVAMGSVQASNPFIKQLTSSDRTTRDRALSALRTYLHRSNAFTPMDLLKLWKGLFYCMWMSDKPRNQQQLARDLADLVDALRSKENILGFIGAFWKTMAREWGNIDALRMDKYLYLVRCYVNKGFEQVAKKDWADEELLDEYLKVLAEVPLNARDMKIPNGMRYHVIDVYVDELDKVDTKRNAPLEKLLQPLRQLGRDTPTKTVRQRAHEARTDERLANWQNIGEEDEEEVEGTEAEAAQGEDDDFGGFDD